VLGAGADAADGSWIQVNGQWPWYFQLDSNNSYCGGTLYVVGDVYTATSDERLKIIEGPITNAIEKVMQLEGFYYYDNEIAKSLGVVGDRRKLGLSAQQLQKVLPEVVVPAPFDQDENLKTESKSKSGKDYLTAQYDRVVPLLVNAIKEHEHTIQAQQTQIDELKALGGFPADYQMHGSYGNQWSIIGNSVGPPMMMRLSKHIYETVFSVINK
jgi:hypothetical protein